MKEFVEYWKVQHGDGNEAVEQHSLAFPELPRTTQSI
jgi:hypothetical protein